MANSDNNLYKTSDTQEAIFLRIKGVIFVRTEWAHPTDPNERGRAFFFFKNPPSGIDEFLAAWQRGDDANVRVVIDAENFFRDELRGRR